MRLFVAAILAVFFSSAALADGKCSTGSPRPDWQQEILCPDGGDSGGSAE